MPGKKKLHILALIVVQALHGASGVFSGLFLKVLKRLHKNVQEADGRLRVLLQERLGSLLMIHSFAAEEQTENERKTGCRSIGPLGCGKTASPICATSASALSWTKCIFWAWDGAVMAS